MPQIPSPYTIIYFLNNFLPFPFFESMIMFFVYSFIGWIVEVCYYGVTEGKFINRGFLGGPMCPVYGLGFYGVIWFFRPFVDYFPILFFGSAFVATTVELIAGVILYWIFHLRWWDYSEYRFNFKGFICLRFSIYWGVACSLGMYLLHPTVMWIIGLMNRPVIHGTVIILCILMVTDIVISICCIFDFNDRIKFIDRMYHQTHLVSDKLGEQIYDTVDTIITKTSPAVNTTQNSINEFRVLYATNRKEEKELAALHRNRERELAERHRNEEKKLLGEYVNLGKTSIAKTKDAATEKILGTVSIIRSADINLLKRIHISKNDINSETLKFLKTHFDNNYDSISEEFRKERQ